MRIFKSMAEWVCLSMMALGPAFPIVLIVILLVFGSGVAVGLMF